MSKTLLVPEEVKKYLLRRFIIQCREIQYIAFLEQRLHFKNEERDSKLYMEGLFVENKWIQNKIDRMAKKLFERN